MNELEKKLISTIINAGSYISGASLAKICDVSVSTINREIDQLNLLLSDHSCYIEKRRGAGYAFVVVDQAVAAPFINQLLNDIKRNSYLNFSNNFITYYIAQDILISKMTTIDDISNHLFYSKSTISRSLNKVKAFFAAFHLDLISRRNCGIYIEGTEWNKRICMLYLKKIFDMNKNGIHNPDTFYHFFLPADGLSAQVRKQVDTFFSYNSTVHIPYVHYDKIADFILLQQTRRHEGITIQQFTADQIAAAKALPTYRFASAMIQIMPYEIRNDYEEIDVICLSMLLASIFTIRNIDEIPQNEYNSNKRFITDLLEYLSQYYCNAKTVFNDSFMDDMVCSLYCLKLRKLFHFPAANEVVAHSTKRGLLSSDLCVLFSLYYKQVYQESLVEQDLSEVFCLFHHYLTLNQKTYKKYKILIVTRYSLEFTKFSAYGIAKSFEKYVDKIDLREYSDIFRINLDYYDLIVSDIDESDLPKTNVPVANFEYNLPYQNMDHIASFFAKKTHMDMFRIFKNESLHKTRFQNKNDVYDAIYNTVRGSLRSKSQFTENLEQISRIVSFERGNNIVLITSFAIQSQDPFFEVFINDSLFTFDKQTCKIIIFYTRGNGSEQNVQLISQLLDKFLSIKQDYLNDLHHKDYHDMVKSMFSH